MAKISWKHIYLVPPTIFICLSYIFTLRILSLVLIFLHVLPVSREIRRWDKELLENDFFSILLKIKIKSGLRNFWRCSKSIRPRSVVMEPIQTDWPRGTCRAIPTIASPPIRRHERSCADAVVRSSAAAVASVPRGSVPPLQSYGLIPGVVQRYFGPYSGTVLGIRVL